MVRLLQSGLIKPEDMARKYANELFATESMLLAYPAARLHPVQRPRAEPSIGMRRRQKVKSSC